MGGRSPFEREAYLHQEGLRVSVKKVFIEKGFNYGMDNWKAQNTVQIQLKTKNLRTQILKGGRRAQVVTIWGFFSHFFLNNGFLFVCLNNLFLQFSQHMKEYQFLQAGAMLKLRQCKRSFQSRWVADDDRLEGAR